MCRGKREGGLSFTFETFLIASNLLTEDASSAFFFRQKMSFIRSLLCTNIFLGKS